MSRVVIAALLALLSTAIIKADGLSWTDPNQDRLCDGRNARDVAELCSFAGISQTEFESVEGKKKLFRLVVILMPSIQEDAKTADIRLVLETLDHVKHTYSRSVPIEISHSYNPDHSVASTTRACVLDLQFNEKEGVISVLAVDLVEQDKKGTSHRFR